MNIGTILLFLLSFFGAYALVRHIGRPTAIPEGRTPPTIPPTIPPLMPSTLDENPKAYVEAYLKAGVEALMADATAENLKAGVEAYVEAGVEALMADAKAVAQEVLNPAEAWPKEHRAVDTHDRFAIPHRVSKRPNPQVYYGREYRLPSGVIREVTGAVSDVEGTVYLYFGHGLPAYKANDLRRIVRR